MPATAERSKKALRKTIAKPPVGSAHPAALKAKCFELRIKQGPGFRRDGGTGLMHTFDAQDLIYAVVTLFVIPVIFVSLIGYVAMHVDKSSPSILSDSNVRTAIPDLDFASILVIESLAFAIDRRREAEELLEDLSIGCHVAVYETASAGIGGYIVFYVKPRTRLEIVRFAVQPSVRRRGIGDSLIRYAVKTAVETDCDKIVCDLPEDLMPAQLLLKSLGFRYERTLPDDVSDFKDVDMYRFLLTTDTLCPAN